MDDKLNLIFKINKLEVIPMQDSLIDVIKIIHYSVKIKEGDYEVEIASTQELSSPDVTNFTAFSDLTEEIVINWLKSSTNIPVLQAALVEKLQVLKNPTEYKTPPWSS